MRTLSAELQAALAGQTSDMLVVLMRIDLSDAPLRLSSAAFDWTDAEGTTWIGGAGLLSLGESFEREELQGGAMRVEFAATDPSLVKAARHGGLYGARFERSIAFIGNDGQQVGERLVDFVGQCEDPEIDLDPVDPKIRIAVENEVIKLRRRYTMRYTRQAHARYFSGDKFLDFVDDIVDRNIFE